MRNFLVFTVLAAALGCGDSDEPTPAPVQDAAVDPIAPLEIPADCNPIASEWDCLLPFPSDVFLTDAGVVVPEAALVLNPDGDPIDPMIHTPDGASILPPIMALFPDGVDEARLIFHDEDVTVSRTAASPTVLIEAETGAAVMHFAELDPNPEDPRKRALFIRPLERLEHATRYIVAIGDVAAAPQAFARIRDGLTEGHPILEPLAARYEDEIFPALAEHGVDRDGLALAWDFTTQSGTSALGDMSAAISLDPAPTVAITSAEDDVDEHTFRRIEGTLTVPSVMATCEPGAALNRGADGKVAANGTCDVKFLALIPRSVAEGDGPARLLQFGHGFFGDRFEIDDYIADFANQVGMVVIAIDWWGMSNLDLAAVLPAVLDEPSEMFRFTDRIHQGMVNMNAVTAAARGALLGESAFQLAGAPAYDPDEIYFYGISQGHILGGTFMALTEHVKRGVLGVGAAGFTFIMFRSNSFRYYLQLMQQQLPDALDKQKFAAMAQTVLDRIDPITYATLITRPILMQLGIGDTQVPNMAAHVHARALGLSHLQPAPRVIEGLPTVEGPFDGSALVEFDYGIDPLPGHLAKIPEEQNEVHEAVRRQPEGIAQIDAFLRADGVVEHTCDGACDPD